VTVRLGRSTPENQELAMRFIRLGLSGLAFAAYASGSIACGDSVPPSPQGAYLVTFTRPAGCSISGHNAKVGDVTASQRNAVVVDATDGATVTCSVTGAGPFNVSGQIMKGADSLQIAIDSLPTSATKANPAKGSVSFASPNTVKAYVADGSKAPCDFYFADPKESVASGKVWVAFSCPTVIAGGSLMPDTCSLLESYILLENCTQ
jgi:hypothetical protein